MGLGRPRSPGCRTGSGNVLGKPRFLVRLRCSAIRLRTIEFPPWLGVRGTRNSQAKLIDLGLQPAVPLRYASTRKEQ